MVMFHVDDDFDFDEELLETTVNASYCSTLEESGNKVCSKVESIPVHPNESTFLDVQPKDSVADRNEFLKLWKNQNENYQNAINVSFPNKSEVSSRYVKKTVRHRKFPGPAGLLPERQGNISFVASEEIFDELNSENDESVNFEEKEVLSQRSEREFESGAWNSLMDDLGMSGRALISLMNLASLRLKHTRGYKVPFLAVIINNIDCTLPDPTLVVKDPTGDMPGMLHRDVWEKFNTEMTPGSVLALKNVGVISAGTTSRRHVLNITANNLSAIYSVRQEEDIQIIKISELPNGDNSEIINKWEEVVSISLPSEKINKNTTIKSFGVNRGNIPTTSTPNRSFCPTKTLSKPQRNNQTITKPKIQNQPGQPLKKQKILPFKGTNKTTSIFPTQNNTFKIDMDTSIVDSLLDGVDTDSLFEEF